MMPTALGYEGQCGVMRRNLSRKRLKVKLRLEMDVDNHWTLPPRLYPHNMVTALAVSQ